VQFGIVSGTLTVSGTNQLGLWRRSCARFPGGRFHLRARTRGPAGNHPLLTIPPGIAPNVDVLAVTEYRRWRDWRLGLKWRLERDRLACGADPHDTENLLLDMTSDPPPRRSDVVLLTIGMTRAEVDQLQAGAPESRGRARPLPLKAALSRKNRHLVIDDFRFGSGYSMRTGRTEPQVTVGKRITEGVRANVTTGLAEIASLPNIEWRLDSESAFKVPTTTSMTYPPP
jgi:translocation and assembly module TamB